MQRISSCARAGTFLQSCNLNCSNSEFWNLSCICSVSSVYTECSSRSSPMGVVLLLNSNVMHLPSLSWVALCLLPVLMQWPSCKRECG